MALRTVLAISALSGFVTACFYSARAGIALASRDLPVEETRLTRFPEGVSVTLGEDGSPLFLARSPGDLRALFARWPRESDRIGATLDGGTIRRLQGVLQATTLESHTDAIRARIESGSLAGAVYWIHRSQFPDSPLGDPIITPIPD